MLEGEDNAAVDTVSTIADAMVVGLAVFKDNSVLIKLHTLYSEIINKPPYTKPEREKRFTEEVATTGSIRRLKLLAKKLFEDLENLNFLTIRFHILDHIVETISRFGHLNFLDASLFTLSNYDIYKSITISSLRRGNTMDEAGKEMNTSADIEERRNKTCGRMRNKKLI